MGAGVTSPVGEAESAPLRLDFDRRVLLDFCGPVVTSDAGLLAYCELDDALGLSVLAGDRLADCRTGKNGRMRWWVFCGNPCSDVLPATRMSTTASGYVTIQQCAGSSAVKLRKDALRHRARWVASKRSGLRPANLRSLADLSGRWIDRVLRSRPSDEIVLDIDSSVSPTHGDQEQSVWNGHFGCTCYYRLFVFNQHGVLEGCALRPGNVHAPITGNARSGQLLRAIAANLHECAFKLTRHREPGCL